jgi:hypothetical protein
MDDLKKAILDYEKVIQKHKDWNLELQQSIYAGTALGSIYLEPKDRISYVQDLTQKPLASHKMRSDLLVFGKDLDTKYIQSYYEVALTSPKLINPQHPLAVEELIYMTRDERLSNETLIDLLKKIPQGSLPPQDDFQMVLQKLRPTMQPLLSTELPKLYPVGH